MKLKIVSSQIFENHVDSFEEEYDCNLKIFDNEFELWYDNNSVILKDDKIVIKRVGMELEIINNKETFSIFKTPYGAINLMVKGIEFTYNAEPFKFNLKYLIKLEDTKEYINNIQMLIIDK